MSRASLCGALLLPLVACSGADTAHAHNAAQVQDSSRGPSLEQLLEDRDERVELPRRLTEISGLALDGEGRLWGHDDERGAIHRIDPTTGEVLEARVLGPRPVQGDFEGLAWDGARFHLVTSTGTLLSFEPGTDEMVTDYAARATRAGDWCEVEGLAFDPRVGALIMACKTVLRGDQRGLTLLLAVAVPGPDTVEAAPPLPVTVALSLDEATLDALDLPSPLRLSGVALHPLRDQWVLVSAQQARVIEVARDGSVVASVRLRSGRHPQTEGLELDPTGEVLYLADEGAGGRGRVTTYRADGGQP